MSSTLLTARRIITDAFQTIGAYGPADILDASALNDGLRRLNGMMGSWAINPQTIPVIAREVFDLVADKGGPDNPYTIGPSGNLNTTRPLLITGVGLLLNPGTDSEVEIPRAQFTDDSWEANRIKNLSSSQFTTLYYNATFRTSGLGTINLWPVPDNADNDLVLYRPDQISEFADLATSYQFPNGYYDALFYNLAVRLCGPYGRPITPDVAALAAESLGNIKRANTKLTDLPMDPMWTTNGNNRFGYNIIAGNG